MSYCKKYLLIYFFIYSLIKIQPLKQKYNGPKISIYMAIYNKSNYLMKSIGSIQSQTLKEIEIIAVNDYSTDNSLMILEELAKNDSRIRIVNNDKNYGLLYSRAMGIIIYRNFVLREKIKKIIENYILLKFYSIIFDLYNWRIYNQC